MRILAQRFPRMLTLFREFQALRTCTEGGLRATPYGFYLAGNEIMASATFERAECRFVLEMLQHAEVFVDVGANVGFFSCLARQHGARVIAFEPSRENLDCLLFNLVANGWSDVEVMPVALSNLMGVATLHGGGTAASMVPRWAGTSSRATRVIPVSTMDAMLAHRFAGEQLLVKIDVEGAELDVVRGASRLLARHPSPVWLIEICLTEHHPAGQNPDFAAVFATFWDHDYEAFSLLETGDLRVLDRNHVERWSTHGEREFGYVSYVFCKGEPREWVA